ncbi:MAG: hypothetical protein SGILL_001021 [Bacillariaceae sp.]
MMKVWAPPPTATKRPHLCSSSTRSQKRSRLDYESSDEEEEDLDIAGLVTDVSCSDSSTSGGDISDHEADCVRFSSDINFATASHYRADKSNWWSKADRQDFIADCHDLVEDFKEHSAVEHYRRVRSQSHSPSTQASSAFLKTTTVNLPIEARGLEWGFCDKTSDRADHLEVVLSLQEKTADLAPELRWRLLANKSVSSSQPSRDLAKIIGKGDEKSVKEQYLGGGGQLSHSRRVEDYHRFKPVRRVKARMWW